MIQGTNFVSRKMKKTSEVLAKTGTAQPDQIEEKLQPTLKNSPVSLKKFPVKRLYRGIAISVSYPLPFCRSKLTFVNQSLL